MFCRIDICLLLLGSLLGLATCLRWILHTGYYLADRFSVLTATAALAALAAAAAAAAAATTTDRGGTREGATAQGRRAGSRRGRRHITATAAVLLVGLGRQLEDLTELHALVGLHRLLNVGEPGSHFV